jgi:hypothetical protein
MATPFPASEFSDDIIHQAVLAAKDEVKTSSRSALLSQRSLAAQFAV